MEQTEKKRNYLIIILLILFIIFMILYISKEAGYYEYKAHQKVVLTEESIKKFEEDLALGKDVKATDYVTVDYIDYSNKVSDIGATIGSIIDNVMNKILKNTVKILSKLFWE